MAKQTTGLRENTLDYDKGVCPTIDALVARLTNAAQFVALVSKWGEVAGAIRAEDLGEKANTITLILLILILFVVF